MLDFLGSEAPVNMLELFCQNPNKEFYSKEIGKKLGLSKATNIKWLKKLKENGIITETSKGRKKYYKLRLGNPLSRQIRIIFTLSELIPALKNSKELKAAYLVGETARGTSPPDSPIELLILKRGDTKRIEKILDEVSENIGREIKAKIMSPLEYGQLSKEKPKLHERLEREKIRLTIP